MKKSTKQLTKEEQTGRPGRSKSYYISLEALRAVWRLTVESRTESRVISRLLERYAALMAAEPIPGMSSNLWAELDKVLSRVHLDSPEAVLRLDAVLQQQEASSMLVTAVARLTPAQKCSVVHQVECYEAAIARGEKAKLPSPVIAPLHGVRLAARA